VPATAIAYAIQCFQAPQQIPPTPGGPDKRMGGRPRVVMSSFAGACIGSPQSQPCSQRNGIGKRQQKDQNTCAGVGRFKRFYCQRCSAVDDRAQLRWSKTQGCGLRHTLPVAALRCLFFWLWSQRPAIDRHLIKHCDRQPWHVVACNTIGKRGAGEMKT